MPEVTLKNIKELLQKEIKEILRKDIKGIVKSEIKKELKPIKDKLDDITIKLDNASALVVNIPKRESTGFTGVTIIG